MRGHLALSGGLVSLMLLGGACGADKGGGAAPCQSDTQCVRGTVCDEGACKALPCAGNADCLNGNEACIEVAAADVCSAVECGCANCDPCPVGEQCNNGECKSGTPSGCDDTHPCTGDQVCDAGACRACRGAECTAVDCTTSGCEANETCNPTTKTCEPATATAEACDTCATAADCGTGWKCVPLRNGLVCLPPCGSGDDCQTGWACASGVCTPDAYACEGCVTAGCANNQACNPDATPPACIAAVAACGTCAKDWECGDGSACLGGKCHTRCENEVCPGGGGCTANPGGVQVCQAGCEEQCTPACSGGTPVCSGGHCVQCDDNGDCTGGQTCNVGSGLCVNENCAPPTPYSLDGQCVECTNTTQCSGKFCSPETHTCVDDKCASCVDPYPACVEVGGEKYCVQCDADEDCGLGGKCNLTTYACEGGTVTPTDACVNSGDCVGGGTSGFTLTCEPISGYCFDASGMCDDVTAYCPTVTGQVEQCVSILELFGGGSLPTTGLPGGGGTIPGFCGCTTTSPLDLVGNCRKGICMDMAAILAALGGGTPVPGVGGKFCMDLGALLGP